MSASSSVERDAARERSSEFAYVLPVMGGSDATSLAKSSSDMWRDSCFSGEGGGGADAGGQRGSAGGGSAS